MGTLSLRLPASIHRHIREIARQEGVSINQFISSAVADKISALLTEEYVNARAARADLDKVSQILAKVPERPPVDGDEL
jgi:uncharacterized protein (DUF1778 family)